MAYFCAFLEDPETLDAELIQEEEEEAKKEAEKTRPGLTMFTDGSRLEDGAAGYAVTWKRGESWVGIKTHMGYNQEAYDAECAALARALESAARRTTTPERVTIFTDAQAAIRRMASEEPGPGQKYALQARKYIATLRRSRPDITIEIRWCPAHKGVTGNEKPYGTSDGYRVYTAWHKIFKHVLYGWACIDSGRRLYDSLYLRKLYFK